MYAIINNLINMFNNLINNSRAINPMEIDNFVKTLDVTQHWSQKIPYHRFLLD